MTTRPLTRRLGALLAVGLVGTSLHGATLCFEAESAGSLEAPMVKIDASQPPEGVTAIKDAAGNAYIEIPEGKGNPPKVTTGNATYSLTIPADGTYVLWMRVYWEGECSNSFGVQLDEGAEFSFGQDGTYKSWHWVKSPPRLRQLDLKKGACTLTLKNREDGVRVDQILLTTQGRYVPVGVETITAP